MPVQFQPGDFLVFQLEAGYGLLRVLAADESEGDVVWHLAAYSDLFPDVDSVEKATENADRLQSSIRHAALTNRAFESTQVSRIGSAPLTANDLSSYDDWQRSDDRPVSDRSIRLLMGLR